MTSVDADLRSGRRLETGRRSEFIRYILNNISFIVYSPLTYLHCRKNILVLPKCSLKHISSKRRDFDCQHIMFGGRVLQQADSSYRRFVPLYVWDFKLHTDASQEKKKRSYPDPLMSCSIFQMMFFS
jgi:hypothetical protein